MRNEKVASYNADHFTHRYQSGYTDSWRSMVESVPVYSILFAIWDKICPLAKKIF